MIVFCRSNSGEAQQYDAREKCSELKTIVHCFLADYFRFADYVTLFAFCDALISAASTDYLAACSLPRQA
jgi:hypothetical protein